MGHKFIMTIGGRAMNEKEGQRLKCANCIWFESAVVIGSHLSPVSKGQCKAIGNHTVTMVFDSKKCRKLYKPLRKEQK